MTAAAEPCDCHAGPPGHDASTHPAMSVVYEPPKVIGDLYACAECNCHHHSTEDHWAREYVSRLWGEDWDSDEDAVYDDDTSDSAPASSPPTSGEGK